MTYYVRAKRYRGQDGYVVGQRGGPFRVSIFVRSRDGAEEIRDAYKVGREAGEAATNRVFDREEMRHG